MGRRKDVKKTRMIGGLRFRLFRVFRKKSDAKKFAQGQRRRGKLARVVDVAASFAVYTRGGRIGMPSLEARRPTFVDPRTGKRRPSIFFQPKPGELAKIVTLKNSTRARAAAKKLLSLFNRAKRRDRKVRIKRATVLAANRANAMAKKKDLSGFERKEAASISRIYRTASKRMELGT